MPNDLDQVAAAASKNVEITNMRISLQTLLHETCEAREAAPHVGMTRRKPNPHVARDRDHRRSRTSSTRRIRVNLRIHPNAPPVAEINLDQPYAGNGHGPRPTTVLRHNLHILLACFCRSNLHRSKTRSDLLDRSCLPPPGEYTLAAIPLRRATSLTFAPGTGVSSTIRTLSSCDQRRRRSTPPKTSTRIA